jgi:hypothetical protein
MKDKTYNALLARGFDSKLADILTENGYTVTNLKSKDLETLLRLGIPEEIALNLTRESRPPIPENIVIELLYESRMACCICRDTTKSIVIHHIDEWHKSRDHSKDNLVVLCSDHHAEAHTKRELTHTLQPHEIKRIRNKWLSDVASMDIEIIKGAVQNGEAFSTWDYFNLTNTTNTKPFAILRHHNIVDSNGQPNDYKSWKEVSEPIFCLYWFGSGSQLYCHIKQIFEEVLSNLRVINATNSWSKTHLKSLLKPGSIFLYQGAHYFKRTNSIEKGYGQTRVCYRQANKIRAEFQIDAWEATSSSSWHNHLSGYKFVTSICVVRSIFSDNDQLRISASCLAIGSGFTDLRQEVRYPYFAYHYENIDEEVDGESNEVN